MAEASRREFVLATGSLLALTVLGCEKRTAPPPPAQGPADNPSPPMPVDGSQAHTPLPDKLPAGELYLEAFIIGSPADYREAGLYTQYREQGLWLVSTGARLIAMSALCPHNGCPVSFDPRANQYHCPCHESLFKAADGTPLPGGKARRPLERCELRLITAPDSNQQVIQVNPTRTFIQDRRTDEFSDPGAFLPLA